jgi:nitrogen regulatory protein PII
MEHAKKVVIITEKTIADDVTTLIDSLGATGYTTSAAGGKGSRGIRSLDRYSVSDTNANIKVEVIVKEDSFAEKIAEEINRKFFANYSGIIFVEDVKIIRPQKF